MGMQVVICPKCNSDNLRAQVLCWNCGENLANVEPIDSDSRDAPRLPVPEYPIAPISIPTFESRVLAPEKPTSRLQFAFLAGLFFLIILFASIIFQQLHTISRVILTVGISIGFSGTYIITAEEPSTSSEAGENSSGSPFPDWLILLVGIPFVIIVLALLLAVMFGVGFLFEFLIDLFINKDGAERILAIVLGAGLGVIIELSLANLLRGMRNLKTS